MSPYVFQSEPSGSGPVSVALLCRAPVPHFPPGLLQQREQTNGVSCHVQIFNGATLRITDVRSLVSWSSSCLPVSPYGPSCLSLDGCSPCPCLSSPWASASPQLRTKALIWLQETLMFFL